MTDALLFFTSNREAIHHLAVVYLGGDHKAISDAMRGNAVFKINIYANTRAIHSALPPEESGLATSAIGLGAGSGAGLGTRLSNIAVGGGESATRTAELGSVGVSGRNMNISGGGRPITTRRKTPSTSSSTRTSRRRSAITKSRYADIRMRAAINREIDEDRVHHKACFTMLEEREELRGHLAHWGRTLQGRPPTGSDGRRQRDPLQHVWRGS